MATGQAQMAAAGRAGVTIPGVDRIVAVASGKGGVGKSTVAVNLALALRASGCRVGLLDADIYGPSVPIMLGADERPGAFGPDRIRPVERHGIAMISMGFFLNEQTPVIWRGPLAMSATKQFLRGVEWGQVDYLVVDLPPGTGDIALTLAQEVPLSGGIVVTTPQDVALADVRRGVAMLRQVRAPVLGVIENMAGFVCTHCGTRDDVFGIRSRDELEAALGAPVLAEIPLLEEVCRFGDGGRPIVVAAPDHPVSRAFGEAAARVRTALEDGVESSAEAEPAEITQLEGERRLRIAWTDGHVSEYPLTYLRGWCPCAECQGHGGTRRFIETRDAGLSSWEPVGRYAVSFRWQDGHATGIYSHAYLRELCACRLCKPQGVPGDA
jgi:ATP-binding protein involved in chromosome partitioning